MNDTTYMRMAIRLAERAVAEGTGGPFGAVVVKDGRVVGEGQNRVIANKDPTAHAEVMAIRDACQRLDDFQLTGCTLYTSCEPCPMCLGAIYWARPERIVYGCDREDAAEVGFDDDFIYREIPLLPAERKIPTEQVLGQEARRPMVTWQDKIDKTEY